MGSPIIFFGNAAKLLKSALVIPGSTSGALTLTVPGAVTSYTLTLPATQATGTQVLTNDGSGNLSWATNGVGTVTSVSVVSANGLAGTVATDTTTPALTLSTTITGILQGDGTAISAATTTGSGSVVLSASPTLTGTLSGGSGNFSSTLSASNLSGTNTGDVTLTAVGSSPNANGASLSGQSLTLQPAGLTNPGVVTAGAQVLGGQKILAAGTQIGGTAATQTLFGSLASAIFVDNPATIVGYGGKSPFCVGYKANGTEAVPTATASGDTLGGFSGRGHSGSAFVTLSKGLFLVSAEEAWTTTANGTRCTFWTTPIGSATVAERLRIHNDGNISIGNTSSTAKLSVTGTIASSSTVSATQYTSTIATGTAPLVVASTTQVANLNAATAGNVTGIVAIANGGTGQTTAPNAFNALSPMTTGGDIIYGGASGVGTRLANGTNGQVLTSSGGTTAPTWTTPSAASGTVTSVSVVSANGLAGTVANATTTPAITLSTSITGVLQGNGTAISAATTSGANSVMLRDANQNTLINNVVENFATTITVGGTTTLTVASAHSQQFTGASTQTVALPAASSLTLGHAFNIMNRSSGAVTVNGGSGTPIITMAGNSQAIVTVTDIGNTAGAWDTQYTESTVAIAHGGTGQVTKAAAFDALSPMTTGGDLIYGGASGTGTRLANGSAGQILQSNGTTAAPTWVAAPAGGSKNYLTAYTASTSSNTPNPGNGNFEGNTTTGWSLAHSALSGVTPTSAASAGTPFDSTHGGTAANGNLSFVTVASNTLAGNYSADFASSTATTAGDLLISNAFYIDVDDQAKVQTISFAYNLLGGVTNVNFSGTSSNSIAVWIYDVTNAAWIQPAGVYNLIQKTGAGIYTGTFQTTSNSTRYQVALVHVNATIGGYDLYVDDFFVGPQYSVRAPAMSDWTSFTMTIGGSTSAPTKGTNSVDSAQYMRVGANAIIRYDYVQTGAGSGGSGTYLFPLPPGLTAASTATTSTTGDVGLVGSSSGNSNGTNLYAGTVFLYNTSNLALFWSISDAKSYAGAGTTNSISLANATNRISFIATVPISGWSSNSVMSQDTDTRVVAAKYSFSTSKSPTSNNPLDFDTKSYDTHAAVTTGASWKFTAPVSGMYTVEVCFQASGAIGANFKLYKNGSADTSIASMATTNTISGTTSIALVAGDYIYCGPEATTTFGTGAIAINRMSGPAVVAASESVNLIVGSSATAPTGTMDGATTIVFAGVVKDSHNAYSAGTYTIPVSGVYNVFAAVNVSGTSAAGNVIEIFVAQNGTTKRSGLLRTDAVASTNWQASVDGLLSCNAGDTIKIFVSSSLTGAAFVGDANRNYFQLMRVGN